MKIFVSALVLLLGFFSYCLAEDDPGQCIQEMKDARAEFGKEYKKTSSHNADWNIVEWTFDKAHTIITFSWADGSGECYKTTETISPPEGSYYNEPDGFRGLKWGTTLSSLSGLQFVHKDDDGIKYYTIKTDKLTIGSAHVQSIWYGFWRGKLYSSFVVFKGSHNWDIIKGSLFEKFGSGRDLQGESFAWRGGKTNIITSWNRFSNDGSMAMFSTQLEEEKHASLQNEIKDSVKEF